MTTVNPAAVGAPSPTLFLLKSLLSYSAKLRAHHFYKRSRSPRTVRAAYDIDRGKTLERLADVDWDSYVFFPTSLEGFILVDDRLMWGRLSDARRRMLERLSAVTQEHARDDATIVEFGSGDGRNLLFLKRRFPNLRFVGLELSTVSVDLARRAADKFGMNGIEFHVANVCEPLPPIGENGPVTLAFSSFALEMMPAIFRGAVDNMVRLSEGGVLFLEPCSELWPKNLRGVVSRLRVIAMDRLTGLPDAVRQIATRGNWQIESMRRSGLAINSLNEMCDIYIRKVRS